MRVSQDTKSLAWVKWSNVLPSFEKRGLNIGSLKAFNIALLQKWRWRLYRFEQDNDCFIIDRTVNGRWHQNWSRVDIGIRNMAYLIELLLEISQVDLNSEDDTCIWSMVDDGVFSRMPLDQLPHQLNLSARGIDISMISCPSCNGNVESTHIFFECASVKEVWSLVHKAGRSGGKLTMSWQLTCEFASPTAWTHKEEIALCKGWVDVSENNMLGNSRKEARFWLQECGASDVDYDAMALMDYEAKNGTTVKRYNSSGSSSFNTESGEASINLNTNLGDDDEDEVDGNRDDKSGERTKRSVFKDQKEGCECRERDVRNQEYRQCQDDIRFYLQSYDHLTGDARLAMEELRAKIKTKRNSLEELFTQQEKMKLETTQTSTAAKLPMLKQGDYEMSRLRIEQYFQVQDSALWDVIKSENSFVPVTQTTTSEEGAITTTISSPVTAKENIKKKNDVKARSMLLMALSNEHLMTFNQYKDAKSLFAAIETRFGGNEATKKTQKNLLKQMYENFSAINTMSMDDLYNNFKIVEQEVKGTASSSSSSQNMAFVSSSSTNNTNEVYTAYGLVHEDLEQIHKDDLEKMDLKWQLALLSTRAKRKYPEEVPTVVSEPKARFKEERKKNQVGIRSFFKKGLKNKFRFRKNRIEKERHDSIKERANQRKEKKEKKTYRLCEGETAAASCQKRRETAAFVIGKETGTETTIDCKRKKGIDFSPNLHRGRSVKFLKKRKIRRKKKRFLGTEDVQQAHSQQFKSEFERLVMKEDESIDSFVGKLRSIITKAATCGLTFAEQTKVRKVLNAVLDKFVPVVATIEIIVDFKTVKLEEIIGKLKTYEERIKFRKGSQEDNSEKLLFTCQGNDKNYKHSYGNDRRGRGNQTRGRGRGKFTRDSKNEDNYDRRRRNPKDQNYHRKDIIEIKCYNCHEFGHYAGDCPKPDHNKHLEEEPSVEKGECKKHRETPSRFQKENHISKDIKSSNKKVDPEDRDTSTKRNRLLEIQDYEMKQMKEDSDKDKLIRSQIPDNSKKDLGYASYHAVPPPPTGLFPPLKLNLSNSGLEEFQQPKFEGYGPKTSKSVYEDIYNEVKKYPDAPLVKDRVSNNKDCSVESPVVIEKKTVVPTIAKVEFVRPKQ
nr:zinc finger, CCHC-type [Tanacetum cinerariifolium]